MRRVNSQSASTFYKTPSPWPDQRILDLMAMAQHHGVPTRLLDWTTKAFTAAYFAASSALASFYKWESHHRMAVWGLNTEVIGLHNKVVLKKLADICAPSTEQDAFTLLDPIMSCRGG